jgi:hypothetical protein
MLRPRRNPESGTYFGHPCRNSKCRRAIAIVRTRDPRDRYDPSDVLTATEAVAVKCPFCDFVNRSAPTSWKLYLVSG